MNDKQVFCDLIMPKTVVFELTYECNQRCRFCSVPWENPDGSYPRKVELTVADWFRITDSMLEQGIRSIALSGGEPLLKSGVRDLLGHLLTKKVKEPVFDSDNKIAGYQEKPLQITLITNGQLIDRTWIAPLRHPQIAVVVSLPGLQSYGWHTNANVAGPLRAIEMLSEAGIPVIEAVCVTRVNLPELLPTISAGFLAGARQLLINRFLPGGRGMTARDLCLDKSQIAEMLRIAEEACRAANTFGSVGTELPRCVIEGDFKMLDIGTLCSGGIEFFAIDPSGFVRPCNHSPVRLGSWENMKDAIATPYWQSFKTRNFLPGICKGCSVSMICDGGCREAAHLVNGSLDSPDPVFTMNPAQISGSGH